MKRIRNACELCRRKKLRCNGELTCQNCMVYGEECRYVKRVKHDNRAAVQENERYPILYTPLSTSDHDNDEENEINELKNAVKALDKRFDNFELKLEALFSLLRSQQDSERKVKPGGFPSLVSQILSAGALVDSKLQAYTMRTNFFSNGFSSNDLFPHSFPTWKSAFRDVPDKDWAKTCLDWYFRFINCNWPIFYKKQYMESFEKLYIDKNLVKGAWIVSFYAILALAVSRDKRVDNSKLAESFFATAWFLIQRPGFFLTPQLEKIQALVIMIQFASHLSLYNLCKKLCGQVCLMVKDLNLHKESTDKDLDQDMAELHRRIFWVCYIFETTTSLIFGTPPVLGDLEIECKYPDINYAHCFAENVQGDLIFTCEISLTVLKHEIRTKLYNSNNVFLDKGQKGVISNIQTKILNFERAIPSEMKHYFEILKAGNGLPEELDIIKQHFFTACVEIYLSYCNTLIYLYLADDSIEGSKICLSTARAAIDVIKGFLVVLDPISKNICYLWLFLYCPFTPFLTVFSHLLEDDDLDADICVKDVDRLYSIHAFFLKMKDISGEFAERLSVITENFIQSAEQYLALQNTSVFGTFDALSESFSI